jgi:hypothetical protein
MSLIRNTGFKKNTILVYYFFSSGLMWRYAESLELPYAAVPFLDPTGWLQGPLDEIRAEKRLTGYKQRAKLV